MAWYAWVAEVRPGYEEEYKRRHDEIWPEMVQVLKESGIRNYSIFRHGLTLFGCFETEDLDHALGYLLRLFRAGTPNAIGAPVSYDEATKKARLDPDNNLRPGTKYKAVVTTGARDLAGNRLDQNPGVAGSQPKVWVFTTKS
jgi:hypothetical protein